ncbi:alanine racemase C-terminal domain-containing protein, partial [Staphylococcus aureus]|uniref:alanine racemase C-terminal domain-containing protein n=1 Tax=Staphylococcus aureus TaxID=1280 RepID=UPI003BF5808D
PAVSLLMDCQFCKSKRPGISLLGYYPSEYFQEKFKVTLKPSVQLIANVVQTKTLQAGVSVSYGATYTATDPTTIALLPFGYADGYLRIMQGSFVNVNVQKCEVIGRVCMDQTIVKVPDQVKAGASVILIDNQRESPQSVEVVAEKKHTINYEVLGNLSRRLPRHYHNGETRLVTN